MTSTQLILSNTIWTSIANISNTLNGKYVQCSWGVQNLFKLHSFELWVQSQTKEADDLFPPMLAIFSDTNEGFAYRVNIRESN